MANHLIQKLESRFALTDSDKTALVSLTSNTRTIEPRATLILEASVSENVHIIQRGIACRYKILPDGTRAIFAYLIPGDICDLNMPLFGGIDHSISTFGACEVAIVRREILDDCIATHPTLGRALRWAASLDEAILREWVVRKRRPSAEKQAAHLFCELLVRLGLVGLTSRNSFDWPITQADFADTLGLSGVHVNRTLQKLRGTGLIEIRSKRVSIPDPQALQTYAGFNSNYLNSSYFRA
ncbi:MULTISPECIES: Crp/Fnr family transcriptional regulator [Methylobacterium]|uniref:Crp/Fnr family transcriptional regulator n=1 Tax=Methylobacterium TaxID=407 RepID=UPI0009E85C7C|nr:MULTISPECIES: Crp/Fnr family transcriptional regulator [Methylobacterium]MCI9881930.1 Crp/Fnr family transcriptional regulator [Methylobacterium goesingense]